MVRVVLAPWLPRQIQAVTLGSLILARTIPSSVTLVHELEHVNQWRAYGPLLPLAYLAASLGAWLTGGDPYWNNRFEEAARIAERR